MLVLIQFQNKNSKEKCQLSIFLWFPVMFEVIPANPSFLSIKTDENRKAWSLLSLLATKWYTVGITKINQPEVCWQDWSKSERRNSNYVNILGWFNGWASHWDTDCRTNFECAFLMSDGEVFIRRERLRRTR